MTAATFDTLKLARRLEGAGFTRAQADGAAEALADSLSNEIATESDIVEVRASISTLESKLSTEIASLESRLSTEIASVRSATAQWIITAVFINTAGLIGAVATVWQLAHK
jgi:hypothetical protein